MTNFWANYWQLLAPFRTRIFRVLCWIFAMQAATIVEPLIIMTIVDDVVKHGRDAEGRLIPLVIMAFVALIGIGVVKFVKDRHLTELAMTIFRDVQIDCGAKLLRLPLKYHLDTNSGEVVGNVMRGTGKVVDLTFFLLFEIIPLAFQTLFAFAVLLYLYPPTTLLLVPPIILYLWGTHRSKKKTWESRRKRHGYDKEADRRLGRAVANVMTVQAFAQEQRETDAGIRLRDDFVGLFLKEIQLMGKVELWRNALISLGRITLLFVCAMAVFPASITVGMMILIVTLGERVFTNCYRFGGIYDRIVDSEEPVWEIIKLMKEKEIRYVPEHPTPLPARLSGRIDISNVSFAYERGGSNGQADSVTWALREVSLTVGAGKMLGVAGHSGGGKSTLAKLLLGFHKPATGTIKIDGIDIQDMNLQDFRSAVGLVPQEVELFDDTIRANICYGKPDASDDEIVAAAKAAHAHDFIMEAGGYDTIIGDRGLKLSGGQRQRIGIARALLPKPAILIFDEATSSVDPQTIWDIKRAMNAVRGSCTMIVVSHQLSTIQDADSIVVIKDGKVDGIGKHQSLLRQNAVYRNLVHRQQELDDTSRFVDTSMLS